MIREFLKDLDFILNWRRRPEVGVRGRVTAVVRGPDGQLKQRSVTHNIVTNEGDAMIADQMAETPARTKVDNSNGYIVVGDGFVSESKTVTAVVSQVGSPEAMDATYPKVKGAFGAANDNVTQYQATFEAGDATGNGLDEAGLINNVTPASADMLAYAEISPAVNKGASDTLAILWELTFLGA